MKALRRVLFPIGMASGCGLFVGWTNLHTDEVTVVLMFIALFSFGLGFGWPSGAPVWGLIIGGCVPASQYLSLKFGWPTPYQNTPQFIKESFGALIPALLVAVMGAGIRGLIHPQGRPDTQ